VSRAALLSLTLTDFRSYERATLRPQGASVYLFGANGAGKTNLLEAISLLSPGKGLRGASLTEVGRRLPGEATGRAWAVAAEIERPSSATTSPSAWAPASSWPARPAASSASRARPSRPAGWPTTSARSG
jgi:recombinational DNA repair ATPase RecF